ncbi:MAG: hypothetical protein Q4A70_02075 [Candidatus Saccharibacteria bacterium]|nr:hypothetical protein [Candidatus Saccharibacteria bacterium]
MEQEKDMISNQINTSASVPEQDNTMVAEMNEKKKTGNGMLIGMILCALIALGGVGFGVWAMMDGNTQKEQLNSQISALKSQINELMQQNADLQVQVDDQKEQTTDNENEDQVDDVIDDVSSTWPVTASLVGNEIHFTNSDGGVVVKDNFYSFVGIKDCKTLKEEKILRCSVETTIDKEGDDDRGVIYYGENGKIEHWSASGV